MSASGWIIAIAKWAVIGLVAGGVIVVGLGGDLPTAESVPTVSLEVDQKTPAPDNDVAVQTDRGGDLGPTPTKTATPEETGKVRAIDEGEVEQLIIKQINRRRGESLATSGSVVEKANSIAKKHSRAMAENRRVAYTVAGTSILDRIKQADLEENCEVQRTDKIGFFKGKEVTLIGRVSLRGATQNDVAISIVNAWANGADRDKLYLEKAGSMGVGVVVAGDQAYVTVVMCS